MCGTTRPMVFAVTAVQKYGSFLVETGEPNALQICWGQWSLAPTILFSALLVCTGDTVIVTFKRLVNFITVHPCLSPPPGWLAVLDAGRQIYWLAYIPIQALE